MIGLNLLYPLGGLFFAAIAISGLLDTSNAKRWGNGAFWGLLAVVFLAGDFLPDAVNGLSRNSTVSAQEAVPF